MLNLSLALAQFASKPAISSGYLSPTFLKVSLCILMFVVGAVFGSFLCCQARRLRRRETGKTRLGSRSVCLHCHHQLRWYENLPLVSWLWQRGKCRHCGRPIGRAEILAELLSALALTLITATVDFATITPFGWAIFAVTVIFTLILTFLAIYDGLYGELPGPLLTFSIICAIMIVVLRYWALFSGSQLSFADAAADLFANPASALLAGFTARPTSALAAPASADLLAPLGGALVLGGLYLILYLVSRGRWVGDGDWLLGLAIGLALGTPLAALIALFVANLSACLVATPAALKRQQHQIYFGPFLVAAYVITLALCGIIDL